MADNQKYSVIIVQKNKLERRRMIGQILNDFERYYDGLEYSIEKKEEGHEVIECHHHYYGVSHSQAEEMVRILNECDQVETEVKIFKF